MLHILAINGSYRPSGITDQAIEVLVHQAQAKGMTVEVLQLRDYPIEFCTNCRTCTQLPGTSPGRCPLDDAMGELIEKIEHAEGYILASPTNFYTVTALFKRFMERLVVYAYWPWEMHAPQLRKKGLKGKKAVVLTSCAAPGLWGRVFYSTIKELKLAAKTMGAQPVDSLCIGLISRENHAVLPPVVEKKLARAINRLGD